MQPHCGIIAAVRKKKKEQEQEKDSNRIRVDLPPAKRSRKNRNYPFGTALVEFLVERDMIELTHKFLDSINVIKKSGNTPLEFPKQIKKKKGSYYRASTLFAECEFNTSLLPIKLSLPMVCPPVDWTYKCSEEKKF